jgi:hypothetical protein
MLVYVLVVPIGGLPGAKPADLGATDPQSGPGLNVSQMTFTASSNLARSHRRMNHKPAPGTTASGSPESTTPEAHPLSGGDLLAEPGRRAHGDVEAVTVVSGSISDQHLGVEAEVVWIGRCILLQGRVLARSLPERPHYLDLCRDAVIHPAMVAPERRPSR